MWEEIYIALPHTIKIISLLAFKLTHMSQHPLLLVYPIKICRCASKSDKPNLCTRLMLQYCIH